MSDHTLTTLMKKDWRVFRAPVIGCLVLGSAPYLIGGIVIEADRLQPYPHVAAGEVVSFSAIYGLILTAVMAAAFGGMAFAAERRERSADFMDLLPTRRREMVLSKLLVSTLFVFLCLCVHMSVIVATGWVNRQDNHLHIPISVFDMLVTLAAALGATMMTFGIAWLLSTFLTSPAISASISISLVIALVIAISILSSEYQMLDSTQVKMWGVATVVFGPVCWIAGTIYYVTRVEP